MYTLDFISDCVSPSPHFSAFSFFGPNRFRVGKKSMEDMVYIRILKIVFTIYLSNETLDLYISCICMFLLASEWALPPHFRAFSWFGPNIFRAEKKSIEDIVYIRLLRIAYTILFSNETLDLSISCLLKFLLASEWALPPHFRAFSFFGSNIFRVEQKSMEDIVYIRVLKTAYIILLSNETLDMSIPCLCKFLLASEWGLPPHFRAFSFFGPNIFRAEKKIYWRYCLYTASTNCLYYSSFKWNPWSVNIMSLSDFTSIWMSPSPSFSCIFVKGGYTPKLIKSKVYIVLP